MNVLLDAYVLTYRQPIDYERPWLEFLHLVELGGRIRASDLLQGITGVTIGVRSLFGDDRGYAQRVIADLDAQVRDVPRSGLVFRNGDG